MTALPICLVVAAGVGAMMTSFLGRAVVEHNRVLKEAATERAAWRSIGQVEYAKNVILNSTYTDGYNDAIQAALANDPPLIEGTPVLIESAGTGRWYRLSTSNDFGGSFSSASCLIRDGLSYAAYNYYVETHDLGVSGKPTGRIHTNKTLDLYFAGGQYDGYVSAGEGFAYAGGATPENTTFLRGTDPAAEPKELLSKIDFDALKAKAAWVAPEGLVAEIVLQKTTAAIRLYEPDSTILVPVEKTRQVQVGVELQMVEKTSYRTEWQWVSTRKSRKVWVENTGAGIDGGTDVGGGLVKGYWKTEYYYEDVWTSVEVPDGTYSVPELVPIWETETYTDYVTQTVAGSLVQVLEQPAEGILYVPGTVRRLVGMVGGKLTIVADSNVRVTGNLQYVDAENDLAFLNGTDPTKGAYAPNPAFERDHALAVIAKGDIVYARSTPTCLEINGSLVSAGGTVAMEGVVVAADGTPTRSGSATLKTSLRRFGSIMAAKRPVAILLDNTGAANHGFKAGTSIFDAAAIDDPPPGLPNEEALQFLETVRLDPSDSLPPGGLAVVPGVSALPNLKSYAEVRDLTTRTLFDWGVLDLKSSFVDVDLTQTGGISIRVGGRSGTGGLTGTVGG